MPKRKKKSIEEITSLEDGMILDYITGQPVKDNSKEQVRQRMARAFFHEYGINVKDMEPDFKVRVDGRLKKLDIVIFKPESELVLAFTPQVDAA